MRPFAAGERPGDSSSSSPWSGTAPSGACPRAHRNPGDDDAARVACWHGLTFDLSELRFGVGGRNDYGGGAFGERSPCPYTGAAVCANANQYTAAVDADTHLDAYSGRSSTAGDGCT